MTDDTALRGCLDWIDDNLGRFSSAAAVLDLAIVCRSIRTWPRAGGYLDRIAALSGRLTFDEPRHQLWLIAVLLDTGRLGHPALRSAAQRLADTVLRDHDPSARVELRYILEIGGFEHGLAPIDELATRLVQQTVRHPMKADPERGYAFTHLVLYLSDMAARPVPPGPAAVLGPVADTLLGVYVEARHWDLTAELLLCRRPLGLSPSVGSRAAHESLVGSIVPRGAVPGPEYEGSEDLETVFAQCYHATLATTLYLADAVHNAHVVAS